MKKKAAKKTKPLFKPEPIAWTNWPNKDIAGQIHRGSFDYEDMEKKVMGKTVKERVYISYNGVFMVIKDWIEKDEQGFLDFVKKMEIDKSC